MPSRTKSYRSFNGENNRPSSLYSSAHGSNSNIVLTACVRHNHLFSVYTDKQIISFVSRLLMIGFPATIFRGIVAVIVDTTKANAISARLGSHIGKKILKYVPPLANPYASSAVVYVAWVCRCFAPSEHSLPRSIFGHSFFAPASASMAKLNCFPKFNHAFAGFASTTWSSSLVAKAHNVSVCYITAVALKLCSSVFPARRRDFMQKNKTAISHTYWKRICLWPLFCHANRIYIGEPLVKHNLLEAS